MMSGLAKSFGRKVRSIRMDRGLTQAQLADLTDLSDQWIRRIEAGTTSPSFDTIEALATALNVAPADLFSSSPPKSAPTDRFTFAISGLEKPELDWLIRGATLL